MTRQARHFQWDVILTTINRQESTTDTYTYPLYGPATPAGAITKALVQADRYIRENLHSVEIADKQPMT